MKSPPTPIPVLPDDFVTPDDEVLFDFINSLRASVKARVVAEQERGLSLAEIVVHVREMVRTAESETHEGKSFPSHAFRAISRQAVAWSVEAYQPVVISGGDTPLDSAVLEAQPTSDAGDAPTSDLSLSRSKRARGAPHTQSPN